jgi:uncharacterized protein
MSNHASGPASGPRRISACPECGRPVHEESKPFCSERCRLVDLNRWRTGSYAIPAEDADVDPPANDNGRDGG